MSERPHTLANALIYVRSVEPFEGEEVDWYCCNVGAFHVRRAMSRGGSVMESEEMQKLLLDGDPVIVRAAAAATGIAELKALVKRFETAGELENEIAIHFCISI